MSQANRRSLAGAALVSSTLLVASIAQSQPAAPAPPPAGSAARPAPIRTAPTAVSSNEPSVDAVPGASAAPPASAAAPAAPAMSASADATPPAPPPPAVTPPPPPPAPVVAPATSAAATTTVTNEGGSVAAASDLPYQRSLGLEGALGYAGRLNDSSTGYGFDQRNGVGWHAGVFYNTSRKYSFGLVYGQTRTGNERSTTSTNIDATNDRTVHSVLLDGRLYPYRQDHFRIFLDVLVGLAWESVAANGAFGGNSVQIAYAGYSCSDSGPVGFGLGAGLGADFDVSKNVAFIARGSFTSYGLSSDAIRNDPRCKINGAGSTNEFDARIAIQFRFDLGAPKNATATTSPTAPTLGAGF